MTIRAKIKRHYQKNFWSSPVKISVKELRLLVKAGCKCEWCHTKLLDMKDCPSIDVEGEWKGVMCEDCYKEKRMEYCAICEESFEAKDGPENYFFVIPETRAHEVGQTAGIYRALEFPMYQSCLVGGFEHFYDFAIQLAKAVNIEEVVGDEVPVDRICPDCFKKYTMYFIKTAKGRAIYLHGLFVKQVCNQ